MLRKVAVPALVLTACLAGCTGGSTSAPQATQAGGTTQVTSGSTAGTTVNGQGTTGSSPGARRSPAPAPRRLSHSTATSVSAWYHGRGGANFTSVTRALDRASKARARGGLAAFGRSCAEIGSAARTAQNGPPIPDASASKWYAQALAEYTSSAALCESGAATNDSAVLRQALGEVDAANVNLNRAASILIMALSGT